MQNPFEEKGYRPRPYTGKVNQSKNILSLCAGLAVGEAKPVLFPGAHNKYIKVIITRYLRDEIVTAQNDDGVTWVKRIKEPQK